MTPEKYKILYMKPDELILLLPSHRLTEVLAFTKTTALDLLDEHRHVISDYGRMACERLSTGKLQKTITKMDSRRELSLMRIKTANLLYEVFKVCRLLTMSNKDIVLANFKDTEVSCE